MEATVCFLSHEMLVFFSKIAEIPTFEILNKPFQRRTRDPSAIQEPQPGIMRLVQKKKTSWNYKKKLQLDLLNLLAQSDKLGNDIAIFFC